MIFFGSFKFLDYSIKGYIIFDFVIVDNVCYIVCIFKKNNILIDRLVFFWDFDFDFN